MCFFKKRRLRKEAKAEALKKAEVESFREEPTSKPEPKVVKEESKVIAKEPEAVKEVKPEKKEDTEKKVDTEKAAKYHVSQNKDEKSEFFKQWRVRKQGSQKTIKYFTTQAAAIEFAQDLADKANTTIVIHKLDGSIRKQDYTKK